MNKIIASLYNAVTDVNRASSAMYSLPEDRQLHQRVPVYFRQF